MTDNNKNLNPTNPEPNPGNGGQGKQDNPPEKTFTQAELEAIIADRLKREREKYKDFDAYKKAAEELQKLKESQMSEAEKLQAKLAEYERQLLEKEREAAEARIELLKAKALERAGLPKEWASRVYGADEKEIEEDIKELKKLLGIPTKVGSSTNPASAAIPKPNQLINDLIRRKAGL